LTSVPTLSSDLLFLRRIPFSKVALGVMMLAVIALYVELGTYATPMSDDFAHAISLQKEGFWHYVASGYLTWTGIYSGWVWNGSILSLFELFSLAKWLPLFQVTLSLTAIFLLLSAFKEELTLSTRIWLTVLIQAFWFSITEGLATYLYWVTASMVYYGVSTLTVFQAACLARILRSRYTHKPWMTAVLCLLVFISAGLAADVALVQVLTYGGLGLAIAWKRHGITEDSRRMAIVTGVALLSFGLAYFSPGTKIRMQAEAAAYGTSPQNVLVTLKIAVTYGLLTAARFFSKPLLYLVFLFMPPLARVPVIPLQVRVRLWHILAILVGVSFFFQALHGWARGEELPERMIARAYWDMATLWALFFIFFYRNPALSKRIEAHWSYRRRYLLLAACLLLNRNFLWLIESHPAGGECSHQLEARYRYIAGQKAAGNLELVVPALTVPEKLLPCTDITGNRRHWVNESVAAFLGVNSIRSVRLSAEADTNVSKLQSLAEAHNPEAEFMMGQLYDPRVVKPESRPAKHSFSEPLEGTPPPKDLVHAFQWYMKAARQGHKLAQRVLAGRYARGLGVERSYVNAVTWYLTYRLW